jgi:glycopeptide antibiotics resistance protein
MAIPDGSGKHYPPTCDRETLQFLIPPVTIADGGIKMSQKEKQRLGRAKLLFGLYCLVMLWLLFRWGRTAGEEPYWEQVMRNLNLTPMRTISNYWHVLTNRAYYLEKWEFASEYAYQARHAMINLAGNVLMFIPMGYFFPTIYPKMRNVLLCFFAAAGTLILVEIAQLFTILGSCDVDDLILNLSGVLVGWCLWKTGSLWRNKKKKRK